MIGGAGGSLVAEGGPRLVDLDSFTEEYKPEALEAIGILEDLEADRHVAATGSTSTRPAASAPGTRASAPGRYRDGGDVVVTDADGESYISGPDLGVAVLDEIENPKHSRERFTVGY